MDYDDFVADLKPDWPQCFVEQRMWDSLLAHRFGATAGSDFVLLDPEGRVLARGQGIEQIRETLEGHIGILSL